MAAHIETFPESTQEVDDMPTLVADDIEEQLVKPRTQGELHQIFNAVFGKLLPKFEGVKDLDTMCESYQSSFNASGPMIAEQDQEQTGMQYMETQLKEATSAGKFELRGCAVGRLWAKHMKNNKKLSEGYALCGKNYNEQRLFRAKWVEQEYKSTKVAGLIMEVFFNIAGRSKTSSRYQWILLDTSRMHSIDKMNSIEYDCSL